MRKSGQWLLMLLTLSCCIQISVSRFVNSYPTTTIKPMLPRALEPRLPCSLENIYDCCVPQEAQPANNTCCFGMRDFNDSVSCIKHRNCKYFVTYHYDNDTHYNHTEDGNNHYILDNNTEYGWINYTMLSTAGIGYVAYGISLDDKMGTDLVIVCELTEALEVEVYLTWNYERRNKRLDPVEIKQDKFFKLNLAKYENGTMTCVFALATYVNVVVHNPYYNFTMKRKSLSHQIYLGLLAGGKVINGELGNHEEAYTTGFPNNMWSYTNFCYVGVEVPIYLEERVHAAYMVVLFTFLIPMLSIFSRFYKDYLLWRPVLNKSVFFMTHVYFGIGALVMMTASYVLIAGTRSRDYLPRTQYPTFYHSVIGYSIMAIFYFQFIVGLYRKGTWLQSVTKWCHAFLGWILHIVGAVGLATAPFHTYNVLPCHFYIYPAIWVGIDIGFYIFLSTFIDKTDDAIGHYVKCLSFFTFPFPEKRRTISMYPSRKSKVRRAALAAYIFCSILLTVIMLFYLSVDLTAPCYPAHKQKTRSKNNRRFFK